MFRKTLAAKNNVFESQVFDASLNISGSANETDGTWLKHQTIAKLLFTKDDQITERTWVALKDLTQLLQAYLVSGCLFYTIRGCGYMKLFYLRSTNRGVHLGPIPLVITRWKLEILFFGNPERENVSQDLISTTRLTDIQLLLVSARYRHFGLGVIHKTGKTILRHRVLGPYVRPTVGISGTLLLARTSLKQIGVLRPLKSFHLSTLLLTLYSHINMV